MRNGTGVRSFAGATAAAVVAALIVVAVPGAAHAATGDASISGTVEGGYISDGAGYATAYRLVDGQWLSEAGADIAADGTYSLIGLSAGTYRVSFTDLAGIGWDDEGNQYTAWAEWWDDAMTSTSATDVVVADSASITGINADLNSVQGQYAWPELTGMARPGSTLVADPGAWPAGIPLMYEWYVDGEYIDGATSDRLRLTTAHAGKSVYVVVWGEMNPGYWEGKNSDPVAVELPSIQTGKPTIGGIAVVGSTLTAAAGTWTAGATLSYQWSANGAAIAKATGATYTITAAQLGKKLTVTVTGARDGYASASSTSASTAAVKTGTLKAAAPAIAGSVAVGSTLTAKPGSWTGGTAFTYQWYADGKAIKGATKSTLKLVAAQQGKKISVKVTGKQSGYVTAAKTSASTAKAAKVATPTVSGSASVGAKLTAKGGTWTSGTKLTYQWYADGTKISGATKSTFTVASAQRGKQLTVKTTGKKSGYATVTTTSKATTRVPTVATPKIGGTTKATMTLTASTGSWTSGTAFGYQWYANGKAISGATKKTLTLSNALVGKKITVKVTGKKSGYTTVSKTSAATGAVKSGKSKPASKTSCPSGYPIKGNQTTRHTTDWIYHVPGGQFYNATHPEECFASEKAAQQAGYRASQR